MSAIAAAGGKPRDFWQAFGDADGCVLAEFPGDVVAEAWALSGAFASVFTAKLLTVEETLEAFRSVGGMACRAPGRCQLASVPGRPAVAELQR